MTEFKRNHYVPRVILKNWVTAGPDYEGVHVFEVNSKKFSFSESKGKRGFSFAIVNDLYVPIIDGERIVDAEKWLSSLEGAIGSIIPMMLMGGDIEYRDHLTTVRFVMGLLSLQYRSEYELNHLRKSVINDPDVKAFLGPHSDRTVDQIVVEKVASRI